MLRVFACGTAHNLAAAVHAWIPSCRAIKYTHISDITHAQERRLRFESATKRYHLHFVYSDGEGGEDTNDSSTAAAAAGGKRGWGGKGGGGGAKGGAKGGGGAGGRGAGAGQQLVGTAALLMRGRPCHYGSTAPHEALMEGFFLEASAAKQYIALYKGEVG